jgi:exonuclease SbcD
VTRIAFTADLHVDQYGSKVHAATGLNARLVDYLTTLRFVAQAARDRDCDALVVAGDFTERKHVNEWLIRHIQDALSDGPKRQVFLRGNHDAEVANESIVSVLAEMGPDWHGFARPGLHVVGDVVLCLIPHLDGRWLRTQAGFESVPPQEINRALAEQYLVLARALYSSAQAMRSPERMTRILVAHQGMSGGAMNETQAAFLGDRSLVVDAAALGAIGFDAIVAGHFHRHQVLSTDPLTLYTGSVERVDFAEEGEDKGFVVIDTDHLPAFDWIPTPARRYLTMKASESYSEEDLGGAIVRCHDVDPTQDLASLRTFLEKAGVFDVHDLRQLRPETDAVAGMAEDLAPEAALEAYFADDPDAEALVARGREILEAVS